MPCLSASLPRRMSLLVVGSIAFDALKSPFGERERTLGGSAVHFSLAASYFTEVRVVGPVGDVFGDFQPKLSEESKAADTVFLANIQPDLQREVREECADARLVALDSMNFWIENTRDSLLRTIATVDMLLMNDEEVRQLTEQPTLLKGVRQLMELGPRIVVVKQGEYGSALFSDEDDGFFALPAYPLETVVDPTGAGDSFAGGLLGYLDSQGGATDRATLRRAMTYGSAVASYWVEEFGCERAHRLTREEIDERYEAFRRMTSIEGVAAR